MTTTFDLWFLDVDKDTTIKVGTVDMEDLAALREELDNWGDTDTWTTPTIRFIPEGVEVQFELLS